jgi:hypothetical protein
MRQENPAPTINVDNPAANEAVGRRATRAVLHDEMRVVDNLPDRIPVQRRELEVVEIHFGALLDEIMRMER